jgi:hypothetical protein
MNVPARHPDSNLFPGETTNEERSGDNGFLGENIFKKFLKKPFRKT